MGGLIRKRQIAEVYSLLANRAGRGRGKHSTGNHCLCFNNYSFECDRFPISGKYTVIWGRESHLSRYLKAPYSSMFNEIANYMTNNIY